MKTQNFDQDEINQFNQQASTWWDKNGQFKALHDINPLRLDFILQHAEITGKKIVDIGCGGGILSEAMAQADADVIGIDLAEKALHVATAHAKKMDVQVNYQCTTAEAFATDNPGKFDIVTCMEMLEHVPDPLSVITACATLVKPGGAVFFATINRNLKAFLMAVVGAEYVLKMIPKGTHEYAKFIKPSELNAWCKTAKLTPKQIKGLHYQMLSKRYSLSDDCRVNYFLYAQKS